MDQVALGKRIKAARERVGMTQEDLAAAVDYSVDHVSVVERGVKPPKLEKLVATIRSREISACLVLQARSQLKAIYKDNADTIIGNMDSQVFLGGSEPTTRKELSEALGKETIDTFNTSDTRGSSPSCGTNYQKLGKDMPYLLMKSSVALNFT